MLKTIRIWAINQLGRRCMGNSEKNSLVLPFKVIRPNHKGKKMGNNKKKNGYGKGTFIETKMFLSKAFLSLGKPKSCKYVSTVSVQLLICLLGKRRFVRRKSKRSGRKESVRVDDNRFNFRWLDNAFVRTCFFGKIIQIFNNYRFERT